MELRHLAPSSHERLCVGNCIPPRILVRTKPLSEIIKSSFGLIHVRWVGHHSSRNVLIRIMKISPSQIRSKLGVIESASKWIGSGLGVAQCVRLTSFGWEPRRLKWIHHAKIIGRNQHQGGRDIGWNLPANLVVPSSHRRIRVEVKNMENSYIRIHFGDMRTTKQKRSVRRCSSSKSKASVRSNRWDGS
jgi:hypothetical protein